MTQLSPLLDWLSGSPVTEIKRPPFASQMTPHPQPQKRQTAEYVCVSPLPSLVPVASGAAVQPASIVSEPPAAAVARATAVDLTNNRLVMSILVPLVSTVCIHLAASCRQDRFPIVRSAHAAAVYSQSTPRYF